MYDGNFLSTFDPSAFRDMFQSKDHSYVDKERSSGWNRLRLSISILNSHGDIRSVVLPIWYPCTYSWPLAP